MTSFGLPIASQGKPPIGSSTNSFGIPSAVSFGPASGNFGNVSQSIPAPVFQQTVEPRSNVRFNVQPQVTVACKPGFPLPEDTRRKDYLMSLYVPRKKNYLANRRFDFVGMAVAGIQQVNSALRDIAFDDLDTQLSAYLGTIEDIKSNIDNPAFIQRFVKPYGVYNNRGTHDGQERFAAITNSNVGNIIGVSISNYCFMRDIWGVDMRTGDLLELWYGVVEENNTPFVQILPVIGCTDVGDNNNIPMWFAANYGKKDSIYKSFLQQAQRGEVVQCPIGRLWATPMHHPFQSLGNLKNIVGWDSDLISEDEKYTIGNVALDASKVYKNIEVELSPCKMHDFI